MQVRIQLDSPDDDVRMARGDAPAPVKFKFSNDHVVRSAGKRDWTNWEGWASCRTNQTPDLVSKFFLRSQKTAYQTTDFNFDMPTFHLDLTSAPDIVSSIKIIIPSPKQNISNEIKITSAPLAGQKILSTIAETKTTAQATPRAPEKTTQAAAEAQRNYVQTVAEAKKDPEVEKLTASLYDSPATIAKRAAQPGASAATETKLAQMAAPAAAEQSYNIPEPTTAEPRMDPYDSPTTAADPDQPGASASAADPDQPGAPATAAETAMNQPSSPTGAKEMHTNAIMKLLTQVKRFRIIPPSPPAQISPATGSPSSTVHTPTFETSPARMGAGFLGAGQGSASIAGFLGVTNALKGNPMQSGSNTNEQVKSAQDTQTKTPDPDILKDVDSLIDMILKNNRP